MSNEIIYSPEHEWIKVEGHAAFVGITKHAQDMLGELVYVGLPEIGRKLEKGEYFATIESVKTAAEIYTPVSGTVLAVNTALAGDPGKIGDGIEEGWIVKIKIEKPEELTGFMSEADYRAYKDRI